MQKNEMRRALVVTDDRVSATVLSLILTNRAGLEVTHTDNVDEMLQIARNRETEVILIDFLVSSSSYRGESVDGIKLTQLLKADPSTADLPIILVSAYAQDDCERILNQSGADAFFSKPVVDLQSLVVEIIALLPPENAIA